MCSRPYILFPSYNKRYIYRFVLLFTCFSSSLSGYSQAYDRNISESQLNIDGKKLDGYSTSFDFPAEDVRYGFWKYSRSFGHPKNQRSYYKVVIPETTNDANTDVVVYAQTLSSSHSSIFKLTVDKKGIPKDKHVTYNDQAKELIRDFKLNFYYDYYQEKIDSHQKKIRKLGRKYKRLAKKRKNKKERSAILDQILAMEKEVKDLQLRQMKLQK